LYAEVLVFQGKKKELSRTRPTNETAQIKQGRLATVRLNFPNNQAFTQEWTLVV